MGAVAIFATFFLLLTNLPAHAASSGASTTDGVYTASQAAQGKAVYGKQCSECHGADLKAEAYPPLAGPVFMNQWEGMTLSDLYQMIHDTMPATAPGTLTADQTVQLIAYILKVNKMPAGKSSLPTDQKLLSKIPIKKPPVAGGTAPTGVDQ